MINELLSKIFFPIKNIFAQVYYPVFERQYIDPLTFKEKNKGLVSFESGNNETALLLVIVIAGIISFVLLITFTVNSLKKKKRKKMKLK